MEGVASPMSNPSTFFNDFEGAKLDKADISRLHYQAKIATKFAERMDMSKFNARQYWTENKEDALAGMKELAGNPIFESVYIENVKIRLLPMLYKWWQSEVWATYKPLVDMATYGGTTLVFRVAHLGNWVVHDLSEPVVKTMGKPLIVYPSTSGNPLTIQRLDDFLVSFF